MTTATRGLAAGVQALGTLLRALPLILRALADFFRNLWRALRRRRRPRDRTGCCVEVPPSVYRRADPLLYSQPYLMAQGLAVTWDNPDIQLYLNGAPVPSSSLLPDTEYEVEVRIWNNSYDAPAPGLGVSLSYLSFGAGTTSTAVGKTLVDLGVKGSSQCPAFARLPWRTPDADHYCLQALLEWPDDANPNNNLGQENTEVGAAHSPAAFRLTIGNRAGIPRRFEIEVDAYRLPDLPPCSEEQPGMLALPASRLAESRSRWARALQDQAYGKFPAVENWAIHVEPAQFTLGPEEEREVAVNIEPREAGSAGRQPFNLHAFATDSLGSRSLAGGVTLYVEG